MPIINIKTSPLSTEQKKEYVKRMTEISMEVLGAPEHAHMILIDELPIDALGVGTKTVLEMIEENK